MPSPKFTILIAFYNSAATIEETLRSLQAQTEGSFEALCVDDASTDDGASIVEKYCSSDPRFRLLRRDMNGGQARARNMALAEAKGEFTLMLDADDWFAPDTLEVLWSAAQKDAEVDAMVMRLVKTWSDGREEEYPLTGVPATMTGREAAILSIGWQLHGLYALRTSLMKKQPYFTRARTYDDDNTTITHYLLARRVVLTNATYFYRQHASSCTSGITLGLQNYLVANAHLRTIVFLNHLGRKAQRRTEAYCWHTFVWVYTRLARRRADFAWEDWAQAEETFAHFLRLMRFRRLPLSVWLHPTTWPIRPYSLFRAWQRLWSWRVKE